MRISDWSSDVCSSDLQIGCDKGQPLTACEIGYQHLQLLIGIKHGDVAVEQILDGEELGVSFEAREARGRHDRAVDAFMDIVRKGFEAFGTRGFQDISSHKRSFCDEDGDWDRTV